MAKKTTGELLQTRKKRKKTLLKKKDGTWKPKGKQTRKRKQHLEVKTIFATCLAFVKGVIMKEGGGGGEEGRILRESERKKPPPPLSLPHPPIMLATQATTN